ncbi:MAG TPA: hypothetical protein V6C76_00525 [Drouetiella sp.]
MSEQRDSDQEKEPVLAQEAESKKTSAAEITEQSSERLLPAKVDAVKDEMLPSKPEPAKSVAISPDKFETEWIPGEHLELIKIPPPTIWPATLALGVTGIAFGVVTHWILSVAGLFLFLLGAAGWIEDLRKDVLQ